MKPKSFYRLYFLFFISLFCCFLLNLPIWHSKVKALESGNFAHYQAGRRSKAISLVSIKHPTDSDTAAIHTNLGATYFQSGKFSEAIRQWSEAIQMLKHSRSRAARQKLGQLLIDTAQAYNALGQYKRALELCSQAQEIALSIQERKISVVAQGVLGNAYLIGGDLDAAISAYLSSFEQARSLNYTNYAVTASSNLGNALNARALRYRSQASAASAEGDTTESARLTEKATSDWVAAEAALTRAVAQTQASGDLSEATALLNLVRFWQQSPSLHQDLVEYVTKASAILNKLPPTRSVAYTLMNLASFKAAPEKLKIDSLERVLYISRSLGDRRTESFALGTLGQVYQSASVYNRAIELTREAILAAQQVNAADSLYRWQWQAGRIYKATGNIQSAILSYKQAIATVQSIRGDIIAASKDYQLDVRERVEPVYRELIELLLEWQPSSTQSNFKEVLQFMELLKLAELQSFFGDECIEVASATNSPTALSNTHTALIHSIVLEHKTYIILQRPDGVLKSYSVVVEAKKLQSEIERFRLLLEDVATDEYLAESQRIYNWLIRPLEAELEITKPQILVFINDGVLRNIPMAALHDGHQFLIEKYAMANHLGLALNPPHQALHKTPALVFGLTVEVPPFSSLPNVMAETQGVQGILGGLRFLDNEFTLENLKFQIDKKGYPIVHLATHGKFTGTANTTFLQAFDSRLSLQEFEEVIRKSKRPIELLTLSACQTAAGDNRSTLGLAGVATRSGVKSVLASLWFVNDADTVPLIEDFYTQLRQPNITKAQALRQAQLKSISDPDSHPAIWSSFILVGNWL